jgi:hypothetical protein
MNIFPQLSTFFAKKRWQSYFIVSVCAKLILLQMRHSTIALVINHHRETARGCRDWASGNGRAFRTIHTDVWRQNHIHYREAASEQAKIYKTASMRRQAAGKSGERRSILYNSVHPRAARGCPPQERQTFPLVPYLFHFAKKQTEIRHADHAR